MAHHDVVGAGVADDLSGGVETHGLAVEQRRGEHLGMEPLNPGRDIDQIGEGRRVAFGEAVFAEPLDLIEAVLRELGVVAAPDHAANQHVLIGMDGAHMAEGGHGAAQAIGLVAGEFRRLHGDAHGLFLEQRHAQRLAKHPFQLVRRAAIGRR